MLLLAFDSRVDQEVCWHANFRHGDGEAQLFYLPPVYHRMRQAERGHALV